MEASTSSAALTSTFPAVASASASMSSVPVAVRAATPEPQTPRNGDDLFERIDTLRGNLSYIDANVQRQENPDMYQYRYFRVDRQGAQGDERRVGRERTVADLNKFKKELGKLEKALTAETFECVEETVRPVFAQQLKEEFAALKATQKDLAARIKNLKKVDAAHEKFVGFIERIEKLQNQGRTAYSLSLSALEPRQPAAQEKPASLADYKKLQKDLSEFLTRPETPSNIRKAGFQKLHGIQFSIDHLQRQETADALRQSFVSFWEIFDSVRETIRTGGKDTNLLIRKAVESMELRPSKEDHRQDGMFDGKLSVRNAIYRGINGRHEKNVDDKFGKDNFDKNLDELEQVVSDVEQAAIGYSDRRFNAYRPMRAAQDPFALDFKVRDGDESPVLRVPSFVSASRTLSMGPAAPRDFGSFGAGGLDAPPPRFIFPASGTDSSMVPVPIPQLRPSGPGSHLDFPPPPRFPMMSSGATASGAPQGPGSFALPPDALAYPPSPPYPDFGADMDPSLFPPPDMPFHPEAVGFDDFGGPVAASSTVSRYVLPLFQGPSLEEQLVQLQAKKDEIKKAKTQFEGLITKVEALPKHKKTNEAVVAILKEQGFSDQLNAVYKDVGKDFGKKTEAEADEQIKYGKANLAKHIDALVAKLKKEVFPQFDKDLAEIRDQIKALEKQIKAQKKELGAGASSAHVSSAKKSVAGPAGSALEFEADAISPPSPQKDSGPSSKGAGSSSAAPALTMKDWKERDRADLEKAKKEKVEVAQEIDTYRKMIKAIEALPKKTNDAIKGVLRKYVKEEEVQGIYKELGQQHSEWSSDAERVKYGRENIAKHVDAFLKGQRELIGVLEQHLAFLQRRIERLEKSAATYAAKV